MRIKISKRKLESDFIAEIERLSGEEVMTCYQCGRCSAGCPLVDEMDILPNQIIRLAQLGMEEDLTSVKTIWLCASCFTCFARCPRGVDLSKIMEALRFILSKRGDDHFGPDQVSKELAKGAPQQGLVSLYRKLSS